MAFSWLSNVKNVIINVLIVVLCLYLQKLIRGTAEKILTETRHPGPPAPQIVTEAGLRRMMTVSIS